MRNARKFFLVGVMAVALLAQVACAADTGESVFGDGVALDRMTQPLLADEIVAAYGIYGEHCFARNQGDWHVAIGTPPAGVELEHDPLTVVLNNAACNLTLTHIAVHHRQENILTKIAADTPIPLSGNWGGIAYFENVSANNEYQFYANAKLQPANFSTNFDLEILYSDDPAIADAAAVHADKFAVVEGTHKAEKIPAPGYSLEIEDINLYIETDFDHEIVLVTGTVDLTLPAAQPAGQNYVVHPATLVGATYQQIRTAFNAGISTELPSLEGGYYKIPAAAFITAGLIDETLVDVAPLVEYTIIIRNRDNASGVASYQTFTISFLRVEGWDD